MENVNLKIVATSFNNNVVPFDTLVIYRGGGYDGCFWEYNAFLKDKDSNYYNLYSTGSKGLTDADFANESVLAKELDKLECEFIDLKETEEILYFSKKYNADFVLQIGTLVNKVYDYGYNEMPIVFECQICHKIEVVSSSELDAEFGIGFAFSVGIQDCGDNIQTGDKLICSDCYADGLCSNCGEYVGKENIDRNEMQCKWCLEYEENDSE